MNEIADLSQTRARLRVSGTDGTAFLHGQCTNDIGKLSAGQSVYAAFLNAKGKMRGDAYIVRLQDGFLLAASTGLQASLEKFIITEDVTIEDVGPTFGAWLVLGELPALPPGAVTFDHPLGIGVISPVALTTTVRAEDLEMYRIEAGVPKWGVDLDETTIPVEAGLAPRAISYDKGCYIGQETIARIKTYGHVNRHLVQLAGSGEVAPGAELSAEGKVVGSVTSAAHSIRLGKTLALGYVRRELASAGTILQAGGQSWEVIKLCGE